MLIKGNQSCGGMQRRKNYGNKRETLCKVWGSGAVRLKGSSHPVNLGALFL